MLYLLWALANAYILIFFLIICFKAGRLVKNNIGRLATVVFSIGILSFTLMPGSSDIDTKKSKPDNWEITPIDQILDNTTKNVRVVIEKTPAITQELVIIYGVKKGSGKHVPIRTFIITNGWEMGSEWKAEAVTVTGWGLSNQFEYDIYATVDWKLLGSRIYRSPKHYRGFVQI